MILGKETNTPWPQHCTLAIRMMVVIGIHVIVLVVLQMLFTPMTIWCARKTNALSTLTGLSQAWFCSKTWKWKGFSKYVQWGYKTILTLYYSNYDKAMAGWPTFTWLIGCNLNCCILSAHHILFVNNRSVAWIMDFKFIKKIFSTKS